MNRSSKWFWALVVAQLMFLLVWAGYHEYVRNYAPVILLKGRPVDPQDLLRGDFMILSYDISNVTLPARPNIPGRNDSSDKEVWVLLEQKGRYYEAVLASREELTPKPGQVLVHGNLSPTWANTQNAQVKYGIERYFVPEGMGTPRFKLMEVEASISPTHRLYIKQVLLDGKAFP